MSRLKMLFGSPASHRQGVAPRPGATELRNIAVWARPHLQWAAGQSIFRIYFQALKSRLVVSFLLV